ncbi:MAG: hypothetical protein ACI8UO_002374 [Verrucomicrobiales bacterium]|jgi:hypothetical protein
MKTTLEDLQSRLETNGDLAVQDRAALLELVEELKQESEDWSQHDESEEIRAALAEAAAPGDSSSTVEDRLLRLEAEHPAASTLIGRLADMLSRMGV